MRRAQSSAEAQPLSITSSTGPVPGSAEPASSTGRASATITSAGGGHAQEQQPPGGARRGFLGGVQAQQQADGGKDLADAAPVA